MPKKLSNGHIDMRGQMPASRENLRRHQLKPGDILNPKGRNQFTGSTRPFTDAIKKVANELLPESVRLALNERIRRELFTDLRRVLYRESKQKLLYKDIPDLYPAGCTWAQANGLRLAVSSVIEANTSAGVEMREALEGKATARVEVESGKNDKLDALINEFRRASDIAACELREKGWDPDHPELIPISPGGVVPKKPN